MQKLAVEQVWASGHLDIGQSYVVRTRLSGVDRIYRGWARPKLGQYWSRKGYMGLCVVEAVEAGGYRMVVTCFSTGTGS